MVKRNSTYMAEHADNPQFRSFMANVSQWADQLAQFYPGIIPQPMNSSPPPEYAEKPTPTAPVAEEPKVDAQMESIHENVMSASHISTATAIEPEEELLIELEPKTNENSSNTEEVLKKSAETQYKEPNNGGEYTDDSDVEVISSHSGSARASPPPSTTPAAQNTCAMNPFMEDDGWMLMNKSYEELCKIYEAKREAEEKRRKEIEEQIVSIGFNIFTTVA